VAQDTARAARWLPVPADRPDTRGAGRQCAPERDADHTGASV